MQEGITVSVTASFRVSSRSSKMTQRVLCKYFMHGACLKGEYCEFSHDWNDQANNICTFYQKGACSYGSRCRYDHVKVQNAEHSPFIPSSSHPAGSVRSMGPTTSEVPMPTISHASSLYTGQLSHLSKPFLPPSENPWTVGPQQGLSFSGSALNAQTESRSSFTDSSDKPICSFAAAGTCPRGDECPHIHGDLCATCQKHCLHPFRPEEREEHITQCQRNQKRLEALKLSQEIECSVCLEPVLSKSKPSERKFGLLLSCDHPFCITCIRNWRANTPTPGMDVNSILRSCPVCRKISHFIIPSVIWYSSPEEKEEIIANYKNKLSTIDCKYFDFGNGNCPFGTSCFYKHAYRDGRLEEVKLRHLGAADGSTVIAKNVRLSDFLEQLNI